MAYETGADVTWQGERHAHRLRVCPPGRRGLEVTMAPQSGEVAASIPSSLLPLNASSTVPRGRVTAIAAGGVACADRDVASVAVDAELVAGRAVHRLLARAGAAESDVALRAQVLADLDPDERVVVGSSEAFAADVVRLVRSVWEDAMLRRWLSAPSARFEVPLVFRREDATGVRLVRGTIDCLVPTEEGLLVVEFKTGQRRPSHERQLALYVEAVQAMYPSLRVRGHLAYATRSTAAPPAPALVAGRLPFDD